MRAASYRVSLGTVSSKRSKAEVIHPTLFEMGKLEEPEKLASSRVPESCVHSGADCHGPMHTEHITYMPDTTAPICAFHNQVLRVMRLSLALSKRAVALRGKLTVGQRTKTIEVLKHYRFDPASVERTDAYCKKLAAAQGILLGKLDYRKHRATPTRPDPVDGIRFRMSFKPEKKRGLVTCCKWDVRRV